MSARILQSGIAIGALLTGAVVCAFMLGIAPREILGSAGTSSDDSTATSPPPYKSSVVGTDFDFITESDPSAFERLDYRGLQKFEMPDKRKSDAPLLQEAYVFEATFTDGARTTIALDKEFGSREAAEEEAMRYTPRIGKLPSIYREKLRHIVVHKGGADTTAFAEDKGHFFVIYSGNATKRIATHDLEETFFHEATHASIQNKYLNTAAWRKARSADNAYITTYAGSDEQEDFAESALFAYTMMFHPERLPSAERARIQQQIPNRIAFFKKVYAPQASHRQD